MTLRDAIMILFGIWLAGVVAVGVLVLALRSVRSMRDEDPYS
jgi:hypothetical protein